MTRVVIGEQYVGIFFRRYKTRLNLGEKEIKKTLMRRLGWMTAIIFLHAIAFYAFEPVTFGQALWVTITTITTVGYGDISATSAFGQISTSVIIFLVGIPVLASVWDAWASWRDGIRDQMRSGLYRWNLRGHILIAGYPKDYSDTQMVRLIRAIRSQKSLAKKPIQILTTRFDGEFLPQKIMDLGNVAHVHGLASSRHALSIASAEHASQAIILRDHSENDPEGHAFNICSRIRGANPGAWVTVQVDDPHSKAACRLHRAGATSLLRPVKAYPEIIALSMVTQGVNDLFEDLLSVDGTEFRLIPYKGRIKWSDIQALAKTADYGSPIGVQKAMTTPRGVRFYQPVMAPAPDFEGEIEGIYVISRKKNGESFSDKEWQCLLGHEFEPNDPPCSTLYILNLPVNQACPLEYMKGLLYQLRSTDKYGDCPIVVISESIPEDIAEAVDQKNAASEDFWLWRNLTLVKRVPSEELFEKIEDDTFLGDYDSQSVVAILNNDDDNDPDGYTFELIDVLRYEGGYKGLIIAESESDNERERLYLTGADHCLRPVRGYPGMLARCLTNPGVEKAIEAFFRFSELKIQKYIVAEVVADDESFTSYPDEVTFGEIKEHASRKLNGGLPLSVRRRGDIEEVICPSDKELIPVNGSTVLVLTREARNNQVGSR